MKISKQKTRIGFCECGELFEKPGSSSRKYCNICANNSTLRNKRKYDNKREPRQEYKREMAQKLRDEGVVIDTRVRGNDSIGKPPQSTWLYHARAETIPPSSEQWMAYHNKIKKQMRETLGGYQNYHQDDDENPYEDIDEQDTYY
jgi:hypothetical protein